MATRTFIKWSGSKRSQAEAIIAYFPKDIAVYYEPFLGSGAILGELKPREAVGSDINKPLIELWKKIQKNPSLIADDYRANWESLQKQGHTFFYEVRDRFNQKQSPSDFLFLTRTCVNGLIRYNKKGEFNNSLHHTRKGIKPDQLEKIIYKWSEMIREHTFLNTSYEMTTANAKKGDFVYLDPPYVNTGTRYFGSIDFEKFIEYLGSLNGKGICYALSYDGTRGEKSYLVKLPKKLYKRHVMLHSGNSAFGKVQNGKVEKVYESLYLNY